MRSPEAVLARGFAVSMTAALCASGAGCSAPFEAPSGGATEQDASAVQSGRADGGSAEPWGSGEPGRFSFFVTSLRAIQRLAGSADGFGGDLRFGMPDGLAGADEICRRTAEGAMPGSGAKGWRAFLSATRGPAGGGPVHAIDRIGGGPWYDRVGRLVAATKDDLPYVRPRGADRRIVDDLPNEEGVPNHNPDGTGYVDNHDILTGSDASGHVYDSNWSCTCHDWTSSVGSDGAPRAGHSWPRRPASDSPIASWISALDEAGCGAGIHLTDSGPPNPSNPTVGSGGGYGAIYCFASVP